MSDPAQNELFELMLRHLEDGTSPEETARLEAALRDNPEAQREFAHLLVQLVQLRSIGQEQNLVAFEPEETAVAPTIPRRRRAPAMPWALAAAAVGLIAIGAWFFFGRGRLSPETLALEKIPDATASTNGVARLTHSAGAVWAKEINANLGEGMSLSPGRLSLEQGVVQLEFANKAEVILEGPAQLTLVSGSEATLQFGRLTAHVPPEARGFVVQSGQNRIVDLGTEFGLHRPAGGSLKLDVFEGRVQFSPVGSRVAPEELRAGQAVQFERNRTQPLAADRTAYISEEELRQREVAETRARFEAWRDASRALAQDAATLVHFDFEGQQAGDRFLINRAKAASADKPAQVVRCEWTEGRWSNKGALAFRQFGDRVHATVPGKFNSITYLAWVRVDQMPNYFNGLSLSEKLLPGGVHWQLLYQGSVEFAVKVNTPQVFTEDFPVERGWERFRSKPVITAERARQWLHIAAVYDAPKRMGALYVNGQRVETKPVEQPTEVSIGDFDLGNWIPTNVPTNVWQRWATQRWRLVTRGFRGRMDEFTISSRPYSDDEIARLYEVGKPSNSTRSIRLPTQEGSDPFPSMDPMKDPPVLMTAARSN